MSMTQFAMIEELAFLIKDNLPCKHLVLSIEEVLVDFLLNDTSPDGVLELKPMNPYNRLLLHRLADIFGFVHVSVGEGDDRHLILERCLESSVLGIYSFQPPILVSDILWQKDEYRSPTKSHQILRRKDSLPASKTNTVSSKSSLEEREAAYSEARRRYFPEDSEIKESVTPKPRNIPVVARRMIGHALGLRVSPNSSGGVTSATHKEPGQKYQELSGRENSVGHRTLNLRNSQEMAAVSIQELSSQDRKIVDNSQVRHAATSERESERKIQKKPTGNDKSGECVPPPNGRMGQATSTDTLKQEHVGAAKRMFAHAMRLNGTKELNGLVMKTNAAIPADKD